MSSGFKLSMKYWLRCMLFSLNVIGDVLASRRCNAQCVMIRGDSPTRFGYSVCLGVSSDSVAYDDVRSYSNSVASTDAFVALFVASESIDYVS